MSLSPHHITVEDHGRLVAEAVVSSDDLDDVLLADLHIEAGPVPSGVRTRLVDAVLDLPNSRPGTRLAMTMPAGDTEIVTRMRERCADVNLRSAGASLLLRATRHC